MGQVTAHKRYDKAFKSQAVELTHQPGMSVPKVAADLDVPVNALYRWKKELVESGDDAFRGHGVRTTAEAELFRLRKENAELKMYVDILKKATAFFARNPR